jgi:diaminohydroxyphosphoribosylaminopyrimidine deaminase / 5-amino-6-(5-phosphoribosylamino)uracil reductase
VTRNDADARDLRGGVRSGGNGQDAVDRRMMRRALLLARRGRGSTRPNPMVGSVIVRDGRVVGAGFHQRAGDPHAEIEALARVKGRTEGSTVYVTLEPCRHTGRTPPCTAALIAAGVARVVVAVRDPNPLVDGRGIARLRRAGIRVDVGCLEDACRELNRPFFMWVQEKRPLVTLKVAATLDGFIADGQARPTASPAWITGPAARTAAHIERAAHDAVLVGAGTVRADNPRLTVRLSGRRARRAESDPLRVILDGRLRVPVDAVVLSSVGGTRTLVVGAIGAEASRVKALRAAGAEVELLPGRGGRVEVRQLLRALAKRDIQSLLVEGGAEVHAAFIAAGLVDRVVFFYAPLLLGGGVPVARGSGLSLAKALQLGPLTVRTVGPDLLVRADVRR